MQCAAVTFQQFWVAAAAQLTGSLAVTGIVREEQAWCAAVSSNKVKTQANQKVAKWCVREVATWQVKCEQQHPRRVPDKQMPDHERVFQVW